MATYIRRTYVVTGGPTRAPEPDVGIPFDYDDSDGDGPTLVFHRSPREEGRSPDDVISLLKSEGVKTGVRRTQNPPTGEWWIPLIGLAAAGVPYAKALAAVIQTWLKERKGRQVRIENGRSRITANNPEDAVRILAALTKHEKQLRLAHVTKTRPAAKKLTAKKVTKKRAKK
jgi:hypothetical protein